MDEPAIWGADVSVLQGSPPWQELRRRGAAFAFARCKIGNNPGRDARFSDDVAGGLAAGLAMGAYDFAFPLAHIDPVSNADAFRAAARLDDGSVLGERPGDLPPALDLEWPPPEEWKTRGLTPQGVCDWGLRCIDRMRDNTGGIVLIYSYPYFLDALSGCTGFADLTSDLWIAGGAQYVNGNGLLPDLSKVQPPQGRWISKPRFWQYDGNGGARLPNGVDADFNVFMGDLPAFLTLVQAPRFPKAMQLTTLTPAGAGVIQDAEIRAYRQAQLRAA